MISAGTGDLVAAYAYDLPPERIAQEPLAERDRARMLVVDGENLRDRSVRDLPDELRPGDLLVGNRTRVRAARLRGRRPGGGGAEILVLGRLEGGWATALVRPARKLPPGTLVEIADGLSAVVEGEAPGHPGARRVRLLCAGDPATAIERHGTVPLPPYITAALADPGRYQTVFASGAPVSAAAPTAGLHLTEPLLARLRESGVGWATIDLEVGLGTFAPMTADRVAEHRMHTERFEVGEEAAEAIRRTRACGGRVIAVGTTVVRTLESVARADRTAEATGGETGLFIRPGHHFQVVDGLVTNFHQPRSSLLVLVAAFCGGRWRAAYGHALEKGYRFLSFGDCMLIRPQA